MRTAFGFMTAAIGVLIIATCMAVRPAHATVDPQVEVSGSVISFDDQTVKILNQGSVTVVPRSSAPKKLKKGDVIQVSFNIEEFKKTLPAK